MKLLFYIPGLVDGGAERVMASIASHFAKAGHDVTLAVDFIADQGGPPLDPGVKIVELSKTHAVSIKKLAQWLSSHPPDIALSAIAGNNFKLVIAFVLLRVFCIQNRAKRPVCPAIILTYHGFDEYKTGWMSWLGTISLPLISRFVNRVVAVSRSLARDLRTRWKTSPKNLVHIYNPVEIPLHFAVAKNKSEEEIILSVGRLVPDKRFDLLIKGFAQVRDPETRLVLLGEGPARVELEKLVQELGLTSRVDMPGFVSDPTPYYQRASCFVLTSRKESFGLVLVEALAHGLPTLATRSGGPLEVLDHGRYGKILDENISAQELATVLESALLDRGDPGLRFKRARQFDLPTGMGHYEDLFLQILREKRR